MISCIFSIPSFLLKSLIKLAVKISTSKGTLFKLNSFLYTLYKTHDCNQSMYLTSKRHYRKKFMQKKRIYSIAYLNVIRISLNMRFIEYEPYKIPLYSSHTLYVSESEVRNICKIQLILESRNFEPDSTFYESENFKIVSTL